MLNGSLIQTDEDRFLVTLARNLCILDAHTPFGGMAKGLMLVVGDASLLYRTEAYR